MYEIEFFEDRKGKNEVEDYIFNLQKTKNKDTQIKLRKIISYLDMLKKYGLNLGTQYVKHIEGEIWELRPLRDRILFAYLHNNKFIILNCFIKKSQKTPRREIEKAERLLNRYKKWREQNE